MDSEMPDSNVHGQTVGSEYSEQAKVLVRNAISSFINDDEDLLVESWSPVLPSQLDPALWRFLTKEASSKNHTKCSEIVARALAAAQNGDRETDETHQRCLNMILTVTSVAAAQSALRRVGAEEADTLRDSFSTSFKMGDDEGFKRSCKDTRQCVRKWHPQLREAATQMTSASRGDSADGASTSETQARLADGAASESEGGLQDLIESMMGVSL